MYIYTCIYIYIYISIQKNTAMDLSKQQHLMLIRKQYRKHVTGNLAQAANTTKFF